MYLFFGFVVLTLLNPSVIFICKCSSPPLFLFSGHLFLLFFSCVFVFVLTPQWHVRTLWSVESEHFGLPGKVMFTLGPCGTWGFTFAGHRGNCPVKKDTRILCTAFLHNLLWTYENLGKGKSHCFFKDESIDIPDGALASIFNVKSWALITQGKKKRRKTQNVEKSLPHGSDSLF